MAEAEKCKQRHWPCRNWVQYRAISTGLVNEIYESQKKNDDDDDDDDDEEEEEEEG